MSISRAHVATGRVNTIVAISKNANVANGRAGEDDALEVVSSVAQQLGCEPAGIVIASTGVIGRRYPMDRIRAHLGGLRATMRPADFEAASRGIMTTDTVPKRAAVRVGSAVLVGFAKGVGMIEPDMATLLAFFATDAAIEQPALDAIFRRVVDKTFNCLSIDTDTSTSDTAVILANGAAGPVDLPAFEAALHELLRYLVQCIARDGEGATKLLEVTVDSARDYAQAKRIAKSIVNSPLVKTAVHGADPNWGRVAMAIGKCREELDVTPEKTRIAFSGMEVYPNSPDEAGLARLEAMLARDEVSIEVSLGTGQAAATVWGCDLSAEYVRINGEYTT